MTCNFFPIASLKHHEHKLAFHQISSICSKTLGFSIPTWFLGYPPIRCFSGLTAWLQILGGRFSQLIFDVETLWRWNLARYPWLSCGERQGWHLTSKTHRDSRIGSAWWFGSWSSQPFEQKLVKIGKLPHLLGWKPSVICDETGYDLPKISWAPPIKWTYFKPSNVKTEYTIMLVRQLWLVLRVSKIDGNE